jgi:hypothetical protein
MAAPARLLHAPSALVLLALAIAMAFATFMLAATEGHVVPQVVDLYLVCQYARALAEGHPFHYNAGEPASTGSTSLLHTVLLGLAHAAGFRGEGLIVFAIVAGIAFYVGSVLLARRIGILLAGEREGVLAGALVALGGPVVWGFLYGSDIAPFMFLSLWLFERLLATWGTARLGGAILAASLLALARPEGLLVGLILGGAWTFGPARRLRPPARLLCWIPAALGLLVLGLYRSLTGSWLGTSVADKSLFANYPLSDGIALVSEYLVDVARGLLLGFYPSQVPIGFSRGWAPFYFPPLALLLIAVALSRPPAALRAPLRLWAAVVIVVLVLLAPNTFMGVHFNRYLMWAFPTVHVLAAVGLSTASRLLARDDVELERSLFRAGAAVAVALGFLSTLRFASLYGEMAGEVYRRDWAAAQWIARNLPPGTALANVATSVEYITGHRGLNLHGVTSPQFFGNRTAEREAGVFEAFARVPPAERPGFLITSASIQDGLPTLREMVIEPPLFRTSSFGDDLLIYRMRYDLVGKNGRTFLPGTLEQLRGVQEVDRLNVCDSRDEQAHEYTWSSRVGDLRLNGTARIDTYARSGGPSEVVADAGRAILGHESFRVRTTRGRDLIVVLRTARAMNVAIFRAGSAGQFGLEFPEASLEVLADGKPAARASLRPRPGWDEWVFRVRGDLLGEGRTALTLSGRYSSFYYWFYQ